MDANTVIAVAAIISAGAAIVSTRYLHQQLQQDAERAREESRRSRYATAVDSLWHLDDHWDSKPMVDARRRCAAALLAKNPTRDLDDVLDFFELLALLTDRGVIDDEMAWHAYYWPLVNYWHPSADYIRETRQLEGEATWQDLERLMVRLQAIEDRRRSRHRGAPPVKEQMELYLHDETELPDS